MAMKEQERERSEFFLVGTIENQVSRQVLREDLKDCQEWALLTESGNWLQADGSWFEKERCPLDLVQKDGILKKKKKDVSEEERSRLEGV